MYVLVDKEQLEVRYKHANLRVITDLMHIELAHCTGAAIFINDQRHLGMFSDFELRILGKNLCGQPLPTINRTALIENVATLMKLLSESVLNPLEVAAQAQYIESEDTGCYRFVPGFLKPEKLKEPYTQNALVAPAGFVPVVTSTPTPITAPTPVAALALPTFKPSAAPKTMDSNLEAPKAGSKTGLVWAIADAVYNEQPKPIDLKVMRRLIIDKCEIQGINSSTASVQFSKWVKTKP